MDQNVNMKFASTFFAKDFVDAIKLHRSSTGAVHLATFKYDGKKYILKERLVPELGRKKDMMNEVKLYLQCHHPNVVRCEGWFFDEARGSLFIVLEYCDGGDLCKLIERRRATNESMAEKYVWLLFHQICLGVKHLHENGIVHRDLKTMNILCSHGGRVVKIADLGVSRQVSENTMLLNTFYGTPLYLSPELVQNKPYNEKADMWSLGVILYEMCSLRPPFVANTLIALAKQILKGKYDPLPKKMFSNNVERCVKWLLQVDFSKRPSINQLLLFVTDRLTDGFRGDGDGGADGFVDKTSFALRHACRHLNHDGDATDTDDDDDDMLVASSSANKIKAASLVHKAKNLSNGDGSGGDVCNKLSPAKETATPEKTLAVPSAPRPASSTDLRPNAAPPIPVPPLDIAGIGGWSRDSIRAIDVGLGLPNSPPSSSYNVPSDGAMGRRLLGHERAGQMDVSGLLPGPDVEEKRAALLSRALAPRQQGPLLALLANSRRHEEAMASSSAAAASSQRRIEEERAASLSTLAAAHVGEDSIAVDTQRLRVALRRELSVLRKLLQTRDLLAESPLVPAAEGAAAGAESEVHASESSKIASRLLASQGRIATIEKSIGSGTMARALAEELNVAVKRGATPAASLSEQAARAAASAAPSGARRGVRPASDRALKAFSSPKQLHEDGIATDAHKDGIHCGELDISYESAGKQCGAAQFKEMQKVSLFAARDVCISDDKDGDDQRARARPKTTDGRHPAPLPEPRHTPRRSPRRAKVLKFEGLYESNGLDVADKPASLRNKSRLQQGEEKYIGGGNDSPRYMRTADISSGRYQRQAAPSDEAEMTTTVCDSAKAAPVPAGVAVENTKQKRKDDFRRKNQEKKIIGKTVRYDIITNL